MYPKVVHIANKLLCFEHCGVFTFELPRAGKIKQGFGRCSVSCQQWQDVVAEFPAELAARLLPPEPKRKVKVANGSPLPADISENERVVYGLLSADHPTHIDALASASRLAVSELSGVLLELEMRELIRQLPGKCFVRRL